MRALEKYIVGEFAKLLALGLASFVLLFVMVDVFENMDDIMEGGVPLVRAVPFFVYKIPFIIAQVSPIAVLLAVLLSLGLLAKHNEITAMKAGGVRLLATVKPLLVAGAVVSVGVILMNETLTPAAMDRATRFRAEVLGGGDALQGSFGRGGLWIRGEDCICNIRELDLKAGEIRGVTAYITDEDFTAKRKITARSAVWTEGGWVAPEAEVWDFSEGGLVTKETGIDLVLSGPAPPEEMAEVDSSLMHTGFMELWHYVKSLEREGYDATRYRIDLYGKITFPVVNFIMVLVGIPFALKTGRHSGIAAGVGLSVIIAFSYWLVFAVTRALGQNGILPPILAASFPDVLFAAVGVLMYGYVRQ